MNKVQRLKDRLFKSIGILRYYAIKAAEGSENKPVDGLSKQLVMAEAKRDVIENNEPHPSHADNKESGSLNKNTRTGTRTGTVG